MIEEPIYKKGNPLRGGEPDPNNQQDHTVRAVGAAGGFEGGCLSGSLRRLRLCY